MVRTVHTLRPNKMNFQIYGYESTQVYRSQLLDAEGIENKFLICLPFLNVNWWVRLEVMGFNYSNVTVIPHTFSDLSDTVHSVTESDFEATLSNWGSHVVTTKHASGKTYKFEDFYIDTLIDSVGCVVKYIKRSLGLALIETAIVTEGIFGITDSSGGIKYLNRDGSVALYGKKVDTSFNFSFDGLTWISAEDLTLLYLSSLPISSDDIFINDSLQTKWSKVVSYITEVKGARYSDFLHYNHFYGKALLNRYRTTMPDKPFMVSSPYIIGDLLDEDSTLQPFFVNPIGVSVKGSTPVGLSSSRFLIVGNSTIEKGVDVAVRAFAQIPTASLDVYGFSLAEFKSNFPDIEVPPNVTFKGFVDSHKIPRSVYLGYVSCSITEMYANAMVEACSEGLIPILTDVDYPHRAILSDLGISATNGFTVGSVDGLVSAVSGLLSLPLKERVSLSEEVLNYTKEKFSHEVARRNFLNYLNLYN